MTFDDQDTMDDFSIIPSVTPPLVDPLTEAANAHLAALAQAEAAEMIIKESTQDKLAKTKKPMLPASSTSASSSTTSLSEQQQLLQSDGSSSNATATGTKNDSDTEEKTKLKVPMPLVEENKEPGVSN